MRVLIIDEMHPSIVSMIEELGFSVNYLPNILPKVVQEIISDYDGLVIRSKVFIDADFLNLAPKLKFIARAGAGLDLIDEIECSKRNIEIFAANEGNRVAVAEHLIGMILCLFHKISKANFEIGNNIWNREENRGIELNNKTVGIIGFGNNGQATAERLLGFGCKVMVYDKFKYGFGNHQILEVGMDQIFENADVLSLHLPLTIENKEFVNEKFISKFEKNIYFCNVSRGELVVQHDLVNALKSNKIKGACLDVLENEKINQLNQNEFQDFEFLKSAQNVILTPHVAGWTHESYLKINEVLRDKIKRYLENYNSK